MAFGPLDPFSDYTGMISARTGAILPLLVVFIGSFLPLRAEDEGIGWSDTADLSYVVTAGNSQSTTLGFKNTLARSGEYSIFKLDAGGVRAESVTGTLRAVGISTNFQVVEPPRELSAESYFLKGKYDRSITKRFFWNAGAGWERNRFAGIDNRYSIVGGIGNVWLDRKDLDFRTEYAVTFTRQENVLEVPGSDGTFFGARFSWDYSNKLGGNTTYLNTLVLDGNLDESADYRADMMNSIAAAMNEHLALKVSLQWLFDNRPSFVEVRLENPSGTFTGEKVAVELDKVDTIFTASLVVNF